MHSEGHTCKGCLQDPEVKPRTSLSTVECSTTKPFQPQSFKVCGSCGHYGLPSLPPPHLSEWLVSTLEPSSTVLLVSLIATILDTKSRLFTPILKSLTFIRKGIKSIGGEHISATYCSIHHFTNGQHDHGAEQHLGEKCQVLPNILIV